ncbi:hypothetical protein SCHPADRAFT_993809 [Schizopora paradoxa]|uniref:F-box domain-containing protein n=1 Tax=Schizopora paradoxa TaxID=27342 RepID=A0A0H2S2U4_9AGAM|nr:hypothetical protein SCHPADRAFT_993809 [Schizopora paradoxa]
MDLARDDVRDTVSNWFDEKVALPVQLGKDMDVLKSLSCADIRVNPNFRSNARDIARRLQSISSALEEISMALKGEIDTFRAVTRKCGIAVLPDEVLSTIFDFAYVDWDKRATIGLSHVNRLFRSVMLAKPHLWTDMDSCADMVKTCLPRTRNLPLTVHFTVHCFVEPSACRLDSILTELMPFAKQWGNLKVYFEYWSAGYDEKRHTALPVCRTSVDTPMLRHLSLYSEHDQDAPASPFDWTQWNCPQLQRLDAEYYFPLNLPGLSNVSELFLTLRVDDTNMSGILSQVAKMMNMAYLSFELANTLETNDIVVFERFDFPQIRRLRITTTVHFHEEDFSPALKRSLFSSLFFPGVEELVVEINGTDFVVYESGWTNACTRNYYYNKEAKRIFRHVDQFPNARVFHLQIFTPLGDHHDSDGYSVVSIPLKMLPSVKRFILDGTTRFDIIEPEDQDETYYVEEDAVAPRVIGHTFPILDEMTFESRDTSIASDWVKMYLHEMKDSGRWNALFKLDVFEYNRSGFGERKVYEGEEALVWCDEVVRLRKIREEEARQASNDFDSD